MKLVRQLLTFVVSGGLLGVLIGSLIGPKAISIGESDVTCRYADTLRQGAERLVALQMKGLAIGAAVGLIAGISWAVGRRRRPALEAGTEVSPAPEAAAEPVAPPPSDGPTG